MYTHDTPALDRSSLTDRGVIAVVNRCKELGAPFMAGSSIPGQWRAPFLEHPAGTLLEEAVGIGFSGLDIYGAHALDTLQAMVERRGVTASETGVAAVQCLEGEAVWAAGSTGRFSLELARAACEAVEARAEGVAMEDFEYDADLPATAFIIEYRDGFRATVLMLTGYVNDFGYAARTTTGETVRCEFVSQRAPAYGGTGAPAQGPVAHFVSIQAT